MKYPNIPEVSLELLFLVTVTICFIGTVTKLQLDTGYVRQFENFQEFAKATIKCNLNGQFNDYESQNRNQDLNSSGNETRINDRTINSPESLPICPIDEDRLKYQHHYELNSWFDYGHVQFGGHFKPKGCVSSQKVAIVIPYRDRSQQLEKFSLYIHQFLPDQLVEYTVYVIEQADEKPFNRAKLFNIGVEEINKLDDKTCCFIFHDVDMLPLNQRNLYMCTDRPRHMSPNLSTMRFHLLYPQLFGGAIALTMEQYNKIGGFSNDFYGWGGEDDDAFNKVTAAGYMIDRTPLEFGDYHMMKHVKSKPNPDRYRVLEESRRLKKSADNVVETTPTYDLVLINQEQLYTRISVKL